MSCNNCNTTYPFSNCSSSASNSLRAKSCSPEVCYLKTNFTVLAAGQATEIEVTDSSKLYVGAGIKIGNGYYQVTSIESTTVIEVKHNGVGVDVGTVVVAVHPAYSCFQYPINLVGAVMIESTGTPVGLEANGSTSATFTADSKFILHGKSGPTTLQIGATVSGEITDSDMAILAIPVPYAIDTDFPAALSVKLVEDGALVPAQAYTGTGAYEDYILVAKAPIAAFTPGELVTFTVNGTVQVEL